MTKKTVRLIRRADGIIQGYHVSRKTIAERYSKESYFSSGNWKGRAVFKSRIIEREPEPEKPPAPENQLYTCRLSYLSRKKGHDFSAELSFVSDRELTDDHIEKIFKQALGDQGYEVADFADFSVGHEETAEKAGINELLIRDRSPPDSKKMQMRLERWLA